jgi:hypothetical protein
MHAEIISWTHHRLKSKLGCLRRSVSSEGVAEKVLGLRCGGNDVAHFDSLFEKDTVPSLNTDKTASIASMERIRRMIATYKAKFIINHDKAESDALKLIPAFYD